jgi:hypothetical protein
MAAAVSGGDVSHKTHELLFPSEHLTDFLSRRLGLGKRVVVSRGFIDRKHG